MGTIARKSRKESCNPQKKLFEKQEGGQLYLILSHSVVRVKLDFKNPLYHIKSVKVDY